MLALNFHQTFIPERAFVTKMLDYAASGRKGNIQEISADTGIPMGKSSGKAKAILSYVAGMGLIDVITEKAAVKKPILTNFGKAVYKYDKYLGENIVQWLVHMNLCRHDIGARTWHAVFAKGRNTIGSTYSKGQLEDYLVSLFGKGRSRTGPLLSTYVQDTGLLRSKVLEVKDNMIRRKKAPVLEVYAIPYSAHILTLLDAFFKNQNQITLTDFNGRTLWFEICLWSQHDIENCLSYIEQEGLLSVDRQMRPWIIERRGNAAEAWEKMWDKMH